MAGEVRQPIDVKALEAYLHKHVPEIQIPLDVKQFGFGQSNPTYQLTSPSGARHVLRKKPPGRLVSATAHQVEREHRILAALSSHRATRVPVPRPLCLCADAAVLGTPFYVMEHVAGRIFEDPAVPSAASAGERAALWAAAAETLARLHAVDPAAVGLADYGAGGAGAARGGFYARQVRTWGRLCEAQARARDEESGEEVGQLPRFGELVAFFGDERGQPEDRATLVHGDYKLDNLVFHQTEARVVGILDWEMSTIGHPLSDLANLLMIFYTPTATAGASSPSSTITRPSPPPPGQPTPEALAATYFAAANQPYVPRDLRWAQAFAVFRLAGITQGIAARVARRQASSARAKVHAAARGPLAELAWRMVCELRDDLREDDGEVGERRKARL